MSEWPKEFRCEGHACCGALLRVEQADVFTHLHRGPKRWAFKCPCGVQTDLPSPVLFSAPPYDEWLKAHGFAVMSGHEHKPVFDTYATLEEAEREALAYSRARRRWGDHVYCGIDIQDAKGAVVKHVNYYKRKRS